MADTISPELFDYLVELAALELAPDEGAYLRQQLNNQLKAIHELERIDIPVDVLPAAHGVLFAEATRPALRDDLHMPSDKAAAILLGAPESDDGYFIVPEIPHTELD
jgi:aspartyl-tRNA(Asn)/glutamyl-tRNA(Gln) amidotransferase subunit C